MKDREQAILRLTEIENEAKELRKIIDKPEKVTDRIKTFEDACSELKVNPTFTGLTIDEIAYRKLKIIAIVLNEGWKPDWSDSNEYKYYPYFKYFKYKPGFGFSSTLYGRWDTDPSVGSRLCFKSPELAEYAGKQFGSIYRDFLGE